MLWMVVAVIIGFHWLWLVWDRRPSIEKVNRPDDDWHPSSPNNNLLSPSPGRFTTSRCTKHSAISLIFSIKLLNSFTTRDILLQLHTSLYKRSSPIYWFSMYTVFDFYSCPFRKHMWLLRTKGPLKSIHTVYNWIIYHYYCFSFLFFRTRSKLAFKINHYRQI